MLYYLGFLLVWAQAPRLAGLGMLLLVLLLLPLAWPAGQFLSNYAAGGCFWLGGLWLAWRAPVAPADSRQPWLAMIVLCSLTWRLHPGAGIVRALGFADPTTPDVFLSQLDFLPIALWLSAAAAGRVLPGGRRWAVAAFVLPALSLGWQGLHWPDLARAERIYLPIYLALWLIALAATAWGQPRRLWHGLAGLGGISYAVYAFGMPLQFWMGKQAWLPSGRPASFLLRAALTIALTVAAAWWAERWWQPRWRRVLSR
jgi:peptidoglycan/LPS O-acetylase OafA/YrhL